MPIADFTDAQYPLCPVSCRDVDEAAGRRSLVLGIVFGDWRITTIHVGAVSMLVSAVELMFFRSGGLGYTSRVIPTAGLCTNPDGAEGCTRS
eukprot:121917-Amphidinium_carterae.1